MGVWNKDGSLNDKRFDAMKKARERRREAFYKLGIWADAVSSHGGTLSFKPAELDKILKLIKRKGGA
jgi:hypothetical protein